MLRRIVPLVGFFVLFWTFAASADSDAELIKALRGGGNVLVMRHGATRADQVDVNPHDPKDWKHQRQLNDEGRAAASSMGAALHSLKVPVGKVQTSLFYRAVETGTLLGFDKVTSTEDLTEGVTGMAANASERQGAALRKLAATPPAPGTNTVLVTHKPNIVSAFGKQLSDVGEGETIVCRPDGKGGFVVIGRVQTAEWARIVKAP